MEASCPEDHTASDDNRSKEECDSDSQSDHFCMICNKTNHFGKDCPKQSDEQNPTDLKSDDNTNEGSTGCDSTYPSLPKRYCKKCDKSGHSMRMCRKWKMRNRQDRISKWYTNYLWKLYCEVKDAKCKTKANSVLSKRMKGSSCSRSNIYPYRTM